MPDNRTYYVICGDNCKFEGMTKEQIYAAIAEATGSTPTPVDTAFITKIKEQNANAELKFWIGTTAQFSALSQTAANTLYILSDDDTLESIEEQIDEPKEELLSHKADGNAHSAIPRDNMLLNADFCNLQEISNASATGTVTSLHGWHLPSVTVSYSNTAGISFNPGGTSAVLWQQRKSINGMAGKKLSFSVLFPENGGENIALSVDWFAIDATALSWVPTESAEGNVKTISGIVPANASYARFKITCTGSASVTITRAKAELCGVSTIAQDSPVPQIPYVIESGTSGNWEYRKWSDGNAECWKSISASSLAITSAWGAMYSGIFMGTTEMTSARRYPFDFVSNPNVQVSGKSGNGNFWIAPNVENDSGLSMLQYAPAYQAVRPNSFTATDVVFSYFVTGNWR